VSAALAVDRSDLRILVVGEGDGRERLTSLAGDRLGTSILLPGAVAPAEVGDYLAAMNIASLPQSVDGVGSFRYTTKISEYLAAGLPIVTGEIPLAYDLDEGWVWRLPGDAPWEQRYLSAMAGLMASVDRAELAARRPRGSHASLFDRQRQSRQVVRFVLDVLERERNRGGVRRRPRDARDEGAARSARAGPQA
jgi:glycosyltransferase involved in cell wall biosynthesis